MEPQRFDHFVRMLGRATVRRRLLAGMAMSPFAGLVAADLLVDAEAKKKHKKKRRKKRKPETPEPNAFGCLDVGQPCNGDSANCCSGICAGTPPKKGKQDASRCVAHDTGGCQAGRVPGTSCGNTSAQCTTSTGDPSGVCETTTGNAGFCAASGGCFACTRDDQCQALYGSQAACILCDGCLEEAGGTSCAYA
jgi:hypothetical protein